MLIVDDDGDWRALVGDTLADEGFTVVTAADGRAACDCFRRAKPAVVVTDVEMPSMDGGELLARLHCLDRELPVIVITAEDVQDAPPFTEAFGFIRKPATTDAVTVAVKQALLRGRRTMLGQLWSVARAAAEAAREGGYAVAIRAMNHRRRPTKNVARRPVHRLVVIAGVGVATLAAVLIAALRGPAA